MGPYFIVGLEPPTGGIVEARTDTRYLFINGRPVPLSTEHSGLYDFFTVRK